MAYRVDWVKTLRKINFDGIGDQNPLFDYDPKPHGWWMTTDVFHVDLEEYDLGETLQSTASVSRSIDKHAVRTAHKTKNHRRNAVICCAIVCGFSHRVLAEVFSLPRSRIATIWEEIDKQYRGDAKKRPAVSIAKIRGTEGQNRRHRRDTVIRAVSRFGCGERLLAESLELPRSRVNAILKATCNESRTSRTAEG